MALDGANANLGPESKEWERKLEAIVLRHERELEALRRLIPATSR